MDGVFRIKWREAHGEADRPGRERYSKYVKSIILAGKGDEYYRERTGLVIEIVPEVDPYSVRGLLKTVRMNCKVTVDRKPRRR